MAADEHEFLAEFQRQGEVAGTAAAEQDERDGRRAARTASFDLLAADAKTAAAYAIRSVSPPYEGDLHMAEEAYATGFMDAYIVRIGELSSAAQE